jgi:D-ribose pyranase
VVADAGLPVPEGTMRIDLALKEGVPGFLDALEVILEEVQVESAVIAEEMITTSPQVHKKLDELLQDIPIEIVPHEEFKQMTADARAVVRTGEFTPYANIILVAGVVF